MPSAVLALIAAAIAGCGGGDGGGSGSISVSSNSISATGTPGDMPVPPRIFQLTIDSTADAVYVGYDNGSSGIDQLIVDDGNPVITFSVHYRDPGSLLNGTYNDEIIIRVCNDSACNDQLAGSPVTVRSSYVVSGEGQATMQVTATNLQVRTNNARSVATSPQLVYSFFRPAGSFMTFGMEHTNNGIESGGGAGGASDGYYDFRMKRGQDLSPGVYSDTITLRGCYHHSCVRQVPGSPFVFNVTYTVEQRSDIVTTVLPVTGRTTLQHDIADAKYSRARNSIVMVATTPVNALYVYDIATASDQMQALSAIPRAVAISPDGTRAVVGHDGKISIVELDMLGVAGAPAPQVIDVPMNVFDLVVDSIGRVHAAAQGNGQGGLRSIVIASGAQQQGTTNWLDSGVHLRLHPSGARIYTPDGTSIGGVDQPIVDIARWDVTGSAPLFVNSRTISRTLVEQPHLPCNNLWFDEAGTRIFESCGNVFAVDADPAADLVRTGSIGLSWAQSNFKIGSLDHSAARGELALIEFDATGCPAPNPNIACNQHLRLHDDATLATKSVYNIPAVSPPLGSSALAERGLFVFYSTDGSQLLLLSRLVNAAFETVGFQLSTIQLN